MGHSEKAILLARLIAAAGLAMPYCLWRFCGVQVSVLPLVQPQIPS
jgi:hypothetical protein